MSTTYTTGDDASRKNNKQSQKENTVLVTGRRMSNPLSNFSSYNYNLSLYICTPEAFNSFIGNEKFNAIKNECFVIAQNGGVTNNSTRAMPFDGKIQKGKAGYDYYIDDLVIKLTGPSGSKPLVSTEFEFKIIEPLGFAFMDRLNTASEYISTISPILNSSPHKISLFQQKYMLGIRFYGYDAAGNLISSSKNPDESGSFEKYYPILIQKMEFSINGKAVVYSVSAIIDPLQVTGGEKNGIVKNNDFIIARTVGEALFGSETAGGNKRGLVQILNDQTANEKDTKRVDYPTKYNIEILDDEIKNASLLDYNQLNLKTVPSSPAKSTDENTVQFSIKATSYNSSEKHISIPKGTSVISLIQNIIAKSEYGSKGLSSINDQNIETRTESSARGEFTWFSVNPLSKVTGADSKTHDLTYDITYQIQKYYAPYIRSVYKNITTPFYGVSKKYEFIFTGKNTEIINYQQAFNTLYYTNRASTTTPDSANTAKVDPNVPISTQNGVNVSKDQNKQNLGSEIANINRANLNNIADLAVARITINGDPDYLAQGLSAARTDINEPLVNKLYSTIDQYAISFNTAQIFFEIIFKIAEDYEETTGLLDVSDSVRFYDSQEEIRKMGIKGVVYRLQQVISNFSKGRFTQELEGILVSEYELVPQVRSLANPQGLIENDSFFGVPTPREQARINFRQLENESYNRFPPSSQLFQELFINRGSNRGRPRGISTGNNEAEN